MVGIVAALVAAVLSFATSTALDVGDSTSNGPIAGGERNDSSGTSRPTTSTSSTTSTSTTSTTTTSTTTPPPREVLVAEKDIAETLGSTIEPTRISGQEYTQAVVLIACCNQTPRTTQLDAQRAYTRFRADVGIPDEERSHYRYRVSVSVDGVPLDEFDISFGEIRTVDYGIQGALRVQITMTPLFSDGLGALSSRKLAFANARFVR